MKPHLVLSLLLAASVSSSPLRAESGVWTDSLLAKIRMAATMVPGRESAESTVRHKMAQVLCLLFFMRAIIGLTGRPLAKMSLPDSG